MPKIQVYLLGLATLIGFPAIGLGLWLLFEDSPLLEKFEWSSAFDLYQLGGLLFGVAFAFLALFLFRSPYFKKEFIDQRRLISSMNLNHFDRFFLAFCAGFGEEILFRACLQHWMGLWLTSVAFVAIHGYLNPRKKALFLYGLCLVPFILGLGWAYEKIGLWFSIWAHFAYDLVLFYQIRQDEEEREINEDIPWESHIPE
ncbi:MAG: CPBP family intramembrane metalloprotease [Bacteroidetes bacterium]|nr:MAG: CPBP family intramembrane metalloprotease [Bacteroidota bacterium]